MRYFLDTEFIEQPCTIDLLSVAIVAEDGRELYLENAYAQWGLANHWVKENVLPKLAGAEAASWTPHENIGPLIQGWIGDDTPEFWGYYSDYDWVAFAWLFGAMIDLPEGWPMYCRDLKQEADRLGVTFPQPETDEHHALADARWNRDMYNRYVAVHQGTADSERGSDG